MLGCLGILGRSLKEDVGCRDLLQQRALLTEDRSRCDLYAFQGGSDLLQERMRDKFLLTKQPSRTIS